MSKLPSFEELGQANPGTGERPIGQADAQPIARGYERLGAGLAQLGEGVELAEVAKAKYDFALAHGGFVSDMIGLNEQTQRDLNYGPDAKGQDLSQRYQTQAAAIRDKWAETIGSGPMRGRFTEAVSPQLAEGQARADTHAFGLYRDHQIAKTDELGEDLGNKATATDDPHVHAQAMDAYGAAQDALANRGFITQDQAVAKKRAFGGNLATGLLIQQAETDPLGALNHIRAQPGSDPEMVERILQIESGGNPSARNPRSSAMGLGQFTEGTWLDLIKKGHPDLAKGRSDDELLALRADPKLSRQLTGELLAQNRGALQGQGVPASGGNLYLAHFLGPGGATALLKAKADTPVAALLDPKVIASNPNILAGRTAGSVIQWATDKMGGYAPGEGSIYGFIPPDKRAILETKFLGMTQAKFASDTSDFKQHYQDSVTEAFNTGASTAPLQLSDFVRQFGAEGGPEEYKNYQAQLTLGADKQRVATLDPAAQHALYESYAPKPGTPGYADALKRQDVLGQAIDQAGKERQSDPAAFAIRNLPAARDAYTKLTQTIGNPQASDDDKRAAARDFATKTGMEQINAGVAPADVRILPKGYIDSFNKSISDAANSENPQARLGLIAKVQQEAAMWGDAWPQVMRELAPLQQPIVRAIAAGADPTAMTRLLSIGKDEKPKELLKEQSAVKAADLTKSLDTAMAPFLGTLVGRQRDRDYTGYYGLAETLGALYVRDGMSADEAAAKAFGDLVGKRYDFRDSYRIPKSANVSADDVQAGALAARSNLEAFNVRPAIDDLGLGETNRKDSIAKFARDGKWVTSPDNAGLNLAYGDKFVRTANGEPLKLTWADLSGLGREGRLRGADVTAAGDIAP